MEKREIVFGDFTDFKKPVTLYRSSDKRNTSIYFTNDDEKQEKDTYFEVLHFKYDINHSEFFIRYPNVDHFVEVVGGRSGSSHGNMKISGYGNIWTDKYNSEIEVFEHGDNMLLKFGNFDFNFLEKVDDVNVALDRKFLKLPENVRKISYMYKTTQLIPRYYVVDYPKYNFKYENQRFRIIENNIITEPKIDSFNRYRDGGTTYIKFTDDSGEHTMFSPSKLGNTDKLNLIDDEELVDVTEDEKIKICELLEILLIEE